MKSYASRVMEHPEDNNSPFFNVLDGIDFGFVRILSDIYWILVILVYGDLVFKSKMMMIINVKIIAQQF